MASSTAAESDTSPRMTVVGGRSRISKTRQGGAYQGGGLSSDHQLVTAVRNATTVLFLHQA